MADSRVKKLAETIVFHSLNVHSGEKVLVKGTVIARPLLIELLRLITRLGAEAALEVSFPETERILLTEMPDERVNKMPEIAEYVYYHVDCWINITAPENMYEFSAVAPERLQQAFKALEPLQQHLSKNVRLLECIYPTPALAQEAHMPTEHYEDFVYAACFPDWEKLEKLLQYFKNALDKTEVVEIETPDTKLHFSLEHSVGSTSIGKHCLPDGEVNWKMAKAHPNGHMLFDTLIHASGQICKNVRIEFVNGNIVQVTAEQGEASLLSALHEKQHIFIPTEFSIGGNSAILHPTESMLFEKKRFGTLAFALGSTQDVTDDAPLAVQWHMLKNISRQGELRADGQSIFKDGVPLNF